MAVCKKKKKEVKYVFKIFVQKNIAIFLKIISN